MTDEKMFWNMTALERMAENFPVFLKQVSSIALALNRIADNLPYLNQDGNFKKIDDQLTYIRRTILDSNEQLSNNLYRVIKDMTDHLIAADDNSID